MCFNLMGPKVVALKKGMLSTAVTLRQQSRVPSVCAVATERPFVKLCTRYVHYFVCENNSCEHSDPECSA